MTALTLEYKQVGRYQSLYVSGTDITVRAVPPSMQERSSPGLAVHWTHKGGADKKSLHLIVRKLFTPTGEMDPKQIAVFRENVAKMMTFRRRWQTKPWDEVNNNGAPRPATTEPDADIRALVDDLDLESLLKRTDGFYDEWCKQRRDRTLVTEADLDRAENVPDLFSPEPVRLREGMAIRVPIDYDGLTVYLPKHFNYSKRRARDGTLQERWLMNGTSISLQSTTKEDLEYAWRCFWFANQLGVGTVKIRDRNPMRVLLRPRVRLSYVKASGNCEIRLDKSNAEKRPRHNTTFSTSVGVAVKSYYPLDRVGLIDDLKEKLRRVLTFQEIADALVREGREDEFDENTLPLTTSFTEFTLRHMDFDGIVDYLFQEYTKTKEQKEMGNNIKSIPRPVVEVSGTDIKVHPCKPGGGEGSLGLSVSLEANGRRYINTRKGLINDGEINEEAVIAFKHLIAQYICFDRLWAEGVLEEDVVGLVDHPRDMEPHSVDLTEAAVMDLTGLLGYLKSLGKELRSEPRKKFADFSEVALGLARNVPDLFSPSPVSLRTGTQARKSVKIFGETIYLPETVCVRRVGGSGVRSAMAIKSVGREITILEKSKKGLELAWRRWWVGHHTGLLCKISKRKEALSTWRPRVTLQYSRRDRWCTIVCLEPLQPGNSPKKYRARIGVPIAPYWPDRQGIFVEKLQDELRRVFVEQEYLDDLEGKGTPPNHNKEEYPETTLATEFSLEQIDFRSIGAYMFDQYEKSLSHREKEEVRESREIPGT